MILRKLKTALRTPPYKYGLLVRVLGLSVQAWYLDRFGRAEFRPERWLSPELRQPESDTEIQGIRDIAWAIQVVSKITPWENVCRHQAWQGAVLMSRSGLAFNYFVGAKKGSTGGLDGHSWILSANRFVSGRCNVREYTVVQQFSNINLTKAQ
jgi:hypothetical protein